MLIDPHTWQELLEAVYEINSAKNHADFGSAAVAGLSRLITAEVALFQVFDRSTRRILTRSLPPEPFTDGEVGYYTAHSEEHPLVSHYARGADSRARRVSDVIEESVWLSSNYYLKCLARQGLRYNLALPIIVNASTVAAVSFSRRDPDFSLRDCELLDAFAPHFRQAWEHHEYPWAEHREIAARRRFRDLGLSPRESEVLFWMTEGKQNREIAIILGLRLGTVQEHVANVLPKLGQENRHAGTVFAISRLHQ